MPVFEKGYRRYDGELSRKNRIVPMMLENVRTRVRWWIWILLLLAWSLPYAIYAVFVFIFTAGRALAGDAPITGLGKLPPEVVYETSTKFRTQSIIGMLNHGSPYMFWDAMQWSTLWALLMPAIACSGILAADRRTGALQIYFSRPVSRKDYLVAKAATTGIFTLSVTALPALLLWMESCLFSPDAGYVLDTWYVPFSILMAGCVYAYWNAAIVMALSSVLKRPVIVCVIALVVWFTLSAVGGVLQGTTGVHEWRMVVPQVLLGGITAPLFGLRLPEWLQSPWLLVLGGVLPTGLFALVWLRLRAIEVHT